MLYDKNATDTETIIKISAAQIFIKKGYRAARLREIADNSGIGRTALHYYFRNKETLFETLLNDFFSTVSRRLMKMNADNDDIVAKLKYFVSDYMDTVSKNPEIDLFLLVEYHRNPEIFNKMKNSIQKKMPDVFISIFENAVEKGVLIGDPTQIFITLLSICMFPYAGMGMLKTLMNLSDRKFQRLMTERKIYLHNLVESVFIK
ncbi:TetR/AcrR family transcriptional regulator [Sphingobacterium sp. LRF_L2]|uniref:TetR/AcrR family transcriptional regulator n=1 Tax=Sphingobacterium sp. LRF_L2 TaxID=3369421 RepID=UPI003F5E5F3D